MELSAQKTSSPILHKLKHKKLILFLVVCVLVLTFAIKSNNSLIKKINNEQLTKLQGGSKSEAEGDVSIIGVGGLGDGEKGNAYIRILWFTIRLPW